jgi:L-fuconolactonase
MIRIDAHQHFWRYRAADYPWMGEGMDVLRRDHLPQQLRPLLDAHGITGCIAVQARATEAETDFLLDLAREHDWIMAVIGWVDLRADDLEQRLARWDGQGKLAGFRHLLQDEADVPAVLADESFNRGVTTLQARGQIYEVLVRAPQLADVPAFCARHDRHWLVLDHLGKPAIGGDGDAQWRERLRQLAALPHVLCKVSGLVTEIGDRAMDADVLHRYLDAALELFGAQRLMFGSDWPVCLLKAEYAQVFDILERWAARLGRDEQAALWGGTAARCYGLRLPQTNGMV